MQLRAIFTILAERSVKSENKMNIKVPKWHRDLARTFLQAGSYPSPTTYMDPQLDSMVRLMQDDFTVP